MYWRHRINEDKVVGLNAMNQNIGLNDMTHVINWMIRIAQFAYFMIVVWCKFCWIDHVTDIPSRSGMIDVIMHISEQLTILRTDSEIKFDRDLWPFDSIDSPMHGLIVVLLLTSVPSLLSFPLKRFYFPSKKRIIKQIHSHFFSKQILFIFLKSKIKLEA